MGLNLDKEDQLTLGQRDQSSLAGRVVRKDAYTDETAHTGNLDDMSLVPLHHIRSESSTGEPEHQSCNLF
jgi:hypothetical protein